MLARVRTSNGDVLLFSSGRFLRTLTARWLGLDPSAGKYFQLSTASLSILGFDHDLSDPVIRLWNETALVGKSPLRANTLCDRNSTITSTTLCGSIYSPSTNSRKNWLPPFTKYANL